jgi:hypothetical protein
MSFSRPTLWYHCHADPIWPDGTGTGTFKVCKKKLLLIRMHKSGWYQVGRVLVPRFLAACPHPVTLAGMLIMSNSYLPTSSAWEK